MIEKKLHLGVPLVEYYDETLKQYLGIVFLVHGHTGDKSFTDLQSLPRGFMKRGYYVVAIDAYKHGERIEEPYLTKTGRDMAVAMPEVVKHTAQDIIDLFQTIYSKISRNLIVTGTSMGGHVAFQIPKMFPGVVAIFPLIGSPDMLSHYLKTKKEILGDQIRLCIDQVNDLEISDLEPYLGVIIGIYNGNLDPVVEIEYVRLFYQQLRSRNHLHLEMKEYPIGHQVHEEMVQDLFTFLDKEMI